MFHVEQNNIHIKTRDYSFSNEEFAIIKTNTPGLLKTHPTPSMMSIKKYYDGDNYNSHKTKAVSIFDWVYNLFRIINTFFKVRCLGPLTSKDRILDYGCGTGYFLKSIIRRNYSIVGYEPIKKNDNPLIFSSLSSDKITNTRFTVVTAWHSLEHVHNIDKELKNIFDITDSKSKVVVAVPNYDSLDAKHYKSFWAGYDVPRHIWHFNKKGIVELFESHGFKKIRSAPMFLDAYYVSYLSEKYKGRYLKIFRALLVGTASNIHALFTGNFSSNVFTFKKINK